MGRSVSTPSRAAIIAYQNRDMEESWEWDDYVDCLKYQIQEIAPSFTSCDEWLGREDHAIMENNLCYFGVSEYCGVIALWIVCKHEIGCCDMGPTHYPEDYPYIASFAQPFVDRIRLKFMKMFNEINKVGVFSNGSAIYEKAA